jgi:LCP family protein required for cell wall assembly
LVSLLVLGATGYTWTQLNRIDTGIKTADVIAPEAQTPTGPQAVTVEQNILMVGLDARTDALGNPLPKSLLDMLHAGSSSDGGDTTDTMIVVHIPAGGGAATAISIPRDSYVQIAGGFGMHKINSAYTYGKQAALKTLRAKGVTGADLATQSDAAGASSTIETVQQFTGLTINHYAAVNLAGFYSLSVAVGGVPVCLNAAVNDKYSGANFPAGEQTLSGVQALEFVRQRHGLANSDLDRIVRQQAFLSSMAKTVLGAGTLASPAKLSNLIDAVQSAVVIDHGWDILSFAQQMRGLSSGAIKFGTIPVQSITLQTPYDGDAVKVDPAQVREVVHGLTGNTDTTPTTASGGSTLTTTSGPTPNTGKAGKTSRVSQAANDLTTPTPSTSSAVPSLVSTASGCVN